MKIGAIPKRTQQFPYHRFARGELLVLGKVSHQFQRSRESQACGVVSFHKGHFFSDSPALLLTSVLLLIYSWNVLNVAHSFHQQVATSVSESFQEIIFGHSDPHHSEIKRKHHGWCGFRWTVLASGNLSRWTWHCTLEIHGMGHQNYPFWCLIASLIQESQ